MRRRVLPLLFAAAGMASPISLRIGIVVTGEADAEAAKYASVAADPASRPAAPVTLLPAADKDGAAFSVRPVVVQATSPATQAGFLRALESLVSPANPNYAHVVLSVNPRFAKTAATASVRLGVPVVDVRTASSGLPSARTLLKLARPMREGAKVLAARLARLGASAVAIVYTGNEPLTHESCTAVRSELVALGITPVLTQPFFSRFSPADNALRWHWDSGLVPGSPTGPSSVDSRATFGQTSDVQLLAQTARLLRDRQANHLVACGFRDDVSHLLRELARTNRPLATVTAFPAATQTGFQASAGPMADWSLALDTFVPGQRWPDPVVNSSVGATSRPGQAAAGGVSFVIQAVALALSRCSVVRKDADELFVALENRTAIAAASALRCPEALASPSSSGVDAFLRAAVSMTARTAVGEVRLAGDGTNAAAASPPSVVQLQPTRTTATGAQVARTASVPGGTALRAAVVLPEPHASMLPDAASPVLPIPGSDFVRATSALGVVIVALSATTATVVGLAGVTLMWWRRGETVQAVGLVPSLAVLLGLGLLASWPAQLVGVPTASGCAGRAWILGLGTLLSVLPLIAKTWYRWQVVVEPNIPERQEGVTGAKLARWFLVFGGLEVAVLAVESTGSPWAVRGACVREGAWAYAVVWIATVWHLLLLAWLARLLVVSAFIPDRTRESAAATTVAVTGFISGGVGAVSEAAHQAGTARFSATTAAAAGCVFVMAVVWCSAFWFLFPKAVALLKEAERSARLAKIMPRDAQEDARAKQRGEETSEAEAPTPFASQSPAQLRVNEIARAKELRRSGKDAGGKAPGQPPASIEGRQPEATPNPPRSKPVVVRGSHAQVARLKEEVARLKKDLNLANGQIEVLKIPLREELSRGAMRAGATEEDAKLDELREDIPKRLRFMLAARDAADEAGERARLESESAAAGAASAYGDDARGSALQGIGHAPGLVDDASTPEGMRAVQARTARCVKRHQRLLDGVVTVVERAAGVADDDELSTMRRFGSLAAAAAWMAATPTDPEAARLGALEAARHRNKLAHEARASALAEAAPMSLAAIDAAVGFARLRSTLASEAPADGAFVAGGFHPEARAEESRQLQEAPSPAARDRRRRWDASWRRKRGGVFSPQVQKRMDEAQQAAVQQALQDSAADSAPSAPATPSRRTSPRPAPAALKTPKTKHRRSTAAARALVVVSQRASPDSEGEQGPLGTPARIAASSGRRGSQVTPHQWAAVTLAATSPPPSFGPQGATTPERESPGSRTPCSDSSETGDSVP